MAAYLLYSESADRFYIGQTAKTTERLKSHNEGSVKSDLKNPIVNSSDKSIYKEITSDVKLWLTLLSISQ